MSVNSNLNRINNILEDIEIMKYDYLNDDDASFQLTIWEKQMIQCRNEAKKMRKKERKFGVIPHSRIIEEITKDKIKEKERLKKHEEKVDKKTKLMIERFEKRMSLK